MPRGSEKHQLKKKKKRTQLLTVSLCEPDGFESVFECEHKCLLQRTGPQ